MGFGGRHGRQARADVGDESDTCRCEMTSPQTGMYGFVGLADSPRPWLMMCRSCAGVSCFPTVVSDGTSGEMPPRPSTP